MIQSDNIFYSNFHMNKDLFDTLFQLIEGKLQATANTRPDAIPPEHRLALTLE